MHSQRFLRASRNRHVFVAWAHAVENGGSLRPSDPPYTTVFF
jgi:hypothetical protein